MKTWIFICMSIAMLLWFLSDLDIYLYGRSNIAMVPEYVKA